jgi:hypothetical protein
MNAKIQTFLSGLAKCAGLTIEFPDGAPVRISGFQDGDSPFTLISADQPDSELIFAILQKIGLIPIQSDNFWPRHFPWFLNRPYENESVGTGAYKIRRTMRQKLNSEWRAGLWALCAYPQIGCPNEFRDYLKRHPEKMILMPLVWLGTLKARLTGVFSKSH